MNRNVFACLSLLLSLSLFSSAVARILARAFQLDPIVCFRNDDETHGRLVKRKLHQFAFTICGFLDSAVPVQNSDIDR